MATDKSSGTAPAGAGTLDQSLELAAANAVVAQQQVTITRQAAVASAAAAMLSLFAGGGEAEKAPGKQAAELAGAAELLTAEGMSGSVAFPRVAGFSAALAAIDAENVLASVATLSTLLSALALARFVESRDPAYLDVQKAAEAMLANATCRFERVCSFAADLGESAAAD